jgi:hypothetical protein
MIVLDVVVLNGVVLVRGRWWKWKWKWKWDEGEDSAGDGVAAPNEYE